MKTSVGTDGSGEFAARLREARRYRGLSQERLAERAGLSVRAVRDLERGRVAAPRPRTVELLADALGLPPDERDRFLAGAPGRPRTAPSGPPAAAASPVAPAELPVAVTDFTGRADELARIRAHAMAERGAPAVVSLYGAPGTGKTTLAVAAAATLRDRFPAGALHVDLRGDSAEPLDVGEVVGRFLRSLGVADERVPASVTERAALFRTLTDRARLLILLDNAAHEAQVRPLLPAGAATLVLVTSRRPLTGLECVDRIGLDVLPAAAGQQLLGAIVGARVPADPVATRELVELCGRLPLALRIAGNRLTTRPHWSVGQLVAQLRDQRQRLTALTAGDLGVRAAIDVSYRQLDPAAAEMFRCAALVPGPDFGVELAAAVAGCAVPVARQTAESLVDAGLLAPAGERYRFHDLVRLYARERLDQQPPDRRRSAADRMVCWLLTRTAEAGRDLDVAVPRSVARAERRRSARAWLAAESANWLAAMREASGLGRHRELVEAARALHWYSDSTTHQHPWTEIFGLGVAAAEAVGSAPDEVVLRNFHGWALYLCAERYQEARVVHRRALDQARELGDRREEGWALSYLAAIALRTGQPAEAVESGRRAATIFQEVDFAVGREAAFSLLGSGLAELGRHAEALEFHREVLTSYRRRRLAGAAATEVGEAAATMSIGQDLAGLGRVDEAAEAYATARELFRRQGMPYGEALTAYHQGVLLRDLDRPAAVAVLGDATRLFGELGAVSWELRAREVLAGLRPATRAGARRH